MSWTRSEIVERDKRLLWHPYTSMERYLAEVDPVVVERAEGIFLYDKDGARLVDGSSSWWVNLLGHGHPRLVEAVQRQAAAFAHCSLAGMTHEPAVRLAERLLPRLGSGFTRLFYSDDGSTAVEVAVRMAYQYWRNLGQPAKQRFVTLTGAFHGETVGAASVSGVEVFHEALGGLLFNRVLLPSPARAAMDAERGHGDWHEQAFAAAAGILARDAGRIAAVVVEPLVQGAAGMLMYPPEYLSRLRELTGRLDILLIADEVFVGYGRTGTFLAHHQAGIEPDIVCLAKGFTGGVLPMAATAVTDRIFEAFLGGPERTLWYGHSFTGNPLGCAVANAVLDVLDEERVLEALPERCEALQRGLDRAAAHPWVRDPRRTGTITAFTLIAPGDDGTRSADYLAETGWRFAAEARRRGVLLRPLGNVVYVLLPLTATVAEIDFVFDVVVESLAAAFG
jgi:adenosylmethionine-8-amino-7-oxononanoate aminotransferase